jgi:hypothetical protein
MNHSRTWSKRERRQRSLERATCQRRKTLVSIVASLGGMLLFGMDLYLLAPTGISHVMSCLMICVFALVAVHQVLTLRKLQTRKQELVEEVGRS